MTVELLVIGKTDSAEVGALVAMYSKRISHYLRFAITTLPDVRTTRSTTPQQQKRIEGEAILRQISDGDYVVLLDERGSQMRSTEFMSLSKMTFSHQIVRAIFAEQLYRACTIINNEPYHHE